MPRWHVGIRRVIVVPSRWSDTDAEPGLRALGMLDRLQVRRIIRNRRPDDPDVRAQLAKLGVRWPFTADDEAFLAEQDEQRRRRWEESDRAGGVWTGDCPTGDRCEICGSRDGLTVEIHDVMNNREYYGPWRFTSCESCAERCESPGDPDRDAERVAAHAGHLGWAADDEPDARNAPQRRRHVDPDDYPDPDD